MNDSCSESQIVVAVTDKSPLCSPLTFSAFKNGIKVNIPKTIINPNNGIARYSQYFEALPFVLQHQVSLESMLEKIANSLDEVNSCDCLGEDKSKKLSC